MDLARMQDIGGLRAVVNTFNQVKVLEGDYRHSWFQHELITTTDYIANPKTTGYRSVHLVYKYSNEKNPAYNGLRVELQIRSKLQHAWATAVETLGTFLDQALKSSEGEKELLDFFALAHLEGCPPVPGYEELSKKNAYKKVLKDAKRLKIKDKLQAFSVATRKITTRKVSGFHLIILDTNRKLVSVASYGRERLEEASDDYAKAERNLQKGVQVVLVSGVTVGLLKRAYPNYFLDTTEFIKALVRISNRARLMV